MKKRDGTKVFLILYGVLAAAESRFFSFAKAGGIRAGKWLPLLAIFCCVWQGFI